MYIFEWLHTISTKHAGVCIRVLYVLLTVHEIVKKTVNFDSKCLLVIIKH